MDGYYRPFRLDRNSEGGGLLLYVNENIPCKELKTDEFYSNIEDLFIEINLMKIKWLLFGGYTPRKNDTSFFLAEVSKSLDSYLNTYDNLLLLGDFNSEINDIPMREFMDTYNLKSLIKEPTCFKSALNPSCIDLIFTNQKNSFQNSTAIETGISDFHKMTVTVLKTYFQKQSPTIIRYRNYKKFDNESFVTI